MKEIILKVKEIPEIGMEAENISPDIFAGENLEGIENLRVYVGSRKERLKKFFGVEGKKAEKPEDLKIVIKGNVSRVKRIGQGMSAGEILIKGDAGMHLGSRMKGGKITTEGNVGSWTGMEMSGGKIIIEGNAGNFVGSAYRGNYKGMNGGEILIQGDAGSNIGACMTNGKITIKGNADQFVGVRMQGGLILLEGNVDSRAGAEMMKGIIVIEGSVKEMLPSFMEKGEVEKIKANGEEIKGKFTEYMGDLAEGGDGRVYVKS